MRRIAFAVFGTAMLLTSGLPAFADETSAPATQPATSAVDPDEVICKTLPPETGTRLGNRRVCHKQREWDAIQQQAAATLNRTQIERGMANPGN